MIHWLDTLRATDAARAGGKAAGLGELVHAGFAVPPGFVVGYEAYAAFLAEHPELASVLGEAATQPPEAAERLIKQGFYQLPMPAAVEAVFREAVAALGEAPLAVRSSALGEDGEAASFAGQHVTLLNARGPEQALAGLRACWAGLWSARALAYRARLEDSHAPAIAVVVQALVVPEAAGVAFTADPADGDRSVVVVDAGFGLGEAVVSGRITPDHARVGEAGVIDYQVHAKAVEIVPAGRGVESRPLPRGRQRARVLDDGQLAELYRLARAVEAHFGAPQDLEWAFAQGRLYVLQSRPITALPPPPPPGGWAGPVPEAVWERRNFAEHFPGPVSPLAETLVLPAVGDRLAGLAREVGWVLPKQAMTTLHGYVYTRADMQPAWDLPWRALSHTAGLLLADPAGWQTPPGHAGRLAPLLGQTPETAGAIADWCEAYVRALAEAWIDLHRLSGGWRWSEYALRAALKGDMLQTGRLLSGFESPASALEARLARLGPEPADDEMAACLEAAGHLPASLDPAVSLPLETPEDIRRMAAELARGAAPEARLASAAETRERAVAEVLAEAGPLGRMLLRRLIPWAQAYAREREPAVATLGLGWRTFRERLLRLGALVLEEPTDVFWLEWPEIRRLVSGGAADAALIAERRARHREREGLNAPLAIGHGAQVGSARMIAGIPASAGTYTGVCRVVLGPEDFARLQPGEILVAPATTPAWTPLFHRAGAIVTDVGGPLSHGSIVAREFGIPAVLGTGAATRRLRDGQRVTVDGDGGGVYL